MRTPVPPAARVSHIEPAATTLREPKVPPARGAACAVAAPGRVAPGTSAGKVARAQVVTPEMRALVQGHARTPRRRGRRAKPRVNEQDAGQDAHRAPARARNHVFTRAAPCAAAPDAPPDSGRPDRQPASAPATVNHTVPGMTPPSCPGHQPVPALSPGNS
jgi:hypothetical protein